MNKQIRISFLLLVFSQGLHSVEEYIGKLWEVFAPARLVSSLFSKDLQKGFLIFNIGLFAFGIFCWLLPVRKNYSSAKAFIFFWIIIEIINGVGHLLWAMAAGAYKPGLFTAPILLILSIYLFTLISRSSVLSRK